MTTQTNHGAEIELFGKNSPPEKHCSGAEQIAIPRYFSGTKLVTPDVAKLCTFGVITLGKLPMEELKKVVREGKELCYELGIGRFRDAQPQHIETILEFLNKYSKITFDSWSNQLQYVNIETN